MEPHTTQDLKDESKISKKEKRFREYKKLGFSQPDTVEIVNSLNQLLANYQIHYQKLRNYHWNVVGPDFFDLHEKFEEQYNEAIENIDDIAERIRVFGYTPMSSLREYLANAEIKETGSNLSGMEMVSEVLKDFEILLSYMVNVADAAIDSGDVGTEDMINSFIKKMEKSHWMFTAFATKK